MISLACNGGIGCSVLDPIMLMQNCLIRHVDLQPFHTVTSAYPEHLVRSLILRDGTQIIVRPIRPEDADIEADFVRNLSDESRYFRFMDSLRELSPRMLSHFTKVDYLDHMALIAVVPGPVKEVEVAVARYIVDPDGDAAEFAIVVTDAWQHRGVGQALMQALESAGRARGLQSFHGEVLAGNRKMLAFMVKMGFQVVTDLSDPRVVRVEKCLG